jgi:ParB family chromosome partitioning protein
MATGLATRSARGLAKYDPQRGLKTVAAAEVAEKHYARAKDATKLQLAIRAKLEAQAEFVFWWDTKGPGANHGGKQGRGSETLRGLPDKRQVHRWRKKLNDPDKFEATYESAVSRYLKIIELDASVAHVGQNTGETEWFTPAEYVEAARLVLGVIELDPASTDAANAVVKAEQIYTERDNGLAHRWDGRVWMNPPYAQPLVTQFCEKLAESVKAGTVPAAVVLVNNATETQWFRALADVASAICFPTGRVRFWHPTKASATPLQGQAVIYIGDQVFLFCATFQAFGFLTVVQHDATATV